MITSDENTRLDVVHLIKRSVGPEIAVFETFNRLLSVEDVLDEQEEEDGDMFDDPDAIHHRDRREAHLEPDVGELNKLPALNGHKNQHPDPVLHAIDVDQNDGPPDDRIPKEAAEHKEAPIPHPPAKSGRANPAIPPVNNLQGLDAHAPPNDDLDNDKLANRGHVDPKKLVEKAPIAAIDKVVQKADAKGVEDEEKAHLEPPKYVVPEDKGGNVERVPQNKPVEAPLKGDKNAVETRGVNQKKAKPDEPANVAPDQDGAIGKVVDKPQEEVVKEPPKPRLLQSTLSVMREANGEYSKC